MVYFFCMLFISLTLIASSYPLLEELSASGGVPTITYLGRVDDISDYRGIGKEGYWFPGFSCPVYEYEQPTNFSEANGLEGSWAGPLKHIQRTDLKDYVNRTFSQDGPCSVICGNDMTHQFNVITLPKGQTGGSGIIVDPAAADNSNNSINRIALGYGTPSSFVLSIMVDNCNGQHSSINRIAARGETQEGEPIEPDTTPSLDDKAFNGTPDLYKWLFQGFKSGDYIKVKLNGQAGSVKQGGGASFGGLLFDLP